MGAVLVVVNNPCLGQVLDLLDVGKHVRVEHLAAVDAVEPLDESVLIGLARLDVPARNALGRGSLDKLLRAKFRLKSLSICRLHRTASALVPNMVLPVW